MITRTFHILKFLPTILLDCTLATLLVTLYYLPLLHHGIGEHLLDTFDQRSFIYVFEWFYHCIAGDGDVRSILSPNFFYPHAQTLTWSDLLFGFIPIYIPLRALLDNPITALNLTAITLTFAGALGMMRIGRLVTNRTAMIAPIIATCGLVTNGQEGHLQMKGICLVIWIAYTLLQFSLEAKPKWIAIATLLWGLLFQVSAYLSLMTMYLIPLAILCVIITNRGCLSQLAGLATIAIKSPLVWLTALLVMGTTCATASLYMQGQTVHGGYNLSEFTTYSAKFLSILDAPSSSLIYRPRYSEWGSHEAKLMIGTVGILLAVFACLAKFDSLRKQQVRSATAALAALSLVLALGPYQKDPFDSGKLIPTPGWFLWKFAPGFDAMRVAGRFGLMASVALGLLAELGVESFRSIFRRRAGIVVAVVVLLVFLENRCLLSPVKVKLIQQPKFYAQIKDVTGPSESLVELPLSLDNHFNTMDYFISQELASTLHWRRILIGYSSRASTELSHARSLWHKVSSGASTGDEIIDYFVQIGLDYVIIDKSLMTSETRAKIVAALGVSEPLITDGNKELWRLDH